MRRPHDPRQQLLNRLLPASCLHALAAVPLQLPLRVPKGAFAASAAPLVPGGGGGAGAAAAAGARPPPARRPASATRPSGPSCCPGAPCAACAWRLLRRPHRGRQGALRCRRHPAVGLHDAPDTAFALPEKDSVWADLQASRRCGGAGGRVVAAAGSTGDRGHARPSAPRGVLGMHGPPPCSATRRSGAAPLTPPPQRLPVPARPAGAARGRQPPAQTAASRTPGCPARPPASSAGPSLQAGGAGRHVSSHAEGCVCFGVEPPPARRQRGAACSASRGRRAPRGRRELRECRAGLTSCAGALQSRPQLLRRRPRGNAGDVELLGVGVRVGVGGGGWGGWCGGRPG